MSKLALVNRVPRAYDQAALQEVVRQIEQQENKHAEGSITARHGAMTAAPTAGTFVRGDIVWNSTPVAGGPVGWICVVSGSPGTFVPFGGMPILGTEVATTSGTSIDITGIPSWVTQLALNFVGVSTNGTSNRLIQLGDSGGIETSGYLGVGSITENAVGTSATNYTAGFGLPLTSASALVHGTLFISLEDAAQNTWVASGEFSVSGAAATVQTAGSKSLSGVLDRIRITTSGGVNTHDGGAANIRMS